MLGRLLAVCLGLAACYSPAKPACGFVCGSNGECPEDYFCASDGICHLNGTPMSMVCRPDAMVDGPRPIDAPPPDADVTPPEVVSTTPAHQDTDVAVTSTIVITFSEPVVNLAVPSTLRVTVSSVQVSGTLTPVGNVEYVFTPQAELPAASQIDVELINPIYDFAGNEMAAPYTFSFTTAP